MRRTLLLLFALLALVGAAKSSAADTANIPLADGFDIPVGQNGKGYYKARGVRPNGHLGEDWNGVGGGDTDLGDPIYATADGIVVYAQNFHMGWGNVVIIRHAYLESGETKYLDSLYGHLLEFTVKVGQLVKRGQQIARMGNNNGMYDAHLHFEMRKNIHVGMFRSSFPRDWSVYWSPTEFVAAHHTLPGDSKVVAVPINTFPNQAPPILASKKVQSPTSSVASATDRVVNGQLLTKTTPIRTLAKAIEGAKTTKLVIKPDAKVKSGATATEVTPKAGASTDARPNAVVKTLVKGKPTPTPAPSKPSEKKVTVRHPLFRDRVEDARIVRPE